MDFLQVPYQINLICLTSSTVYFFFHFYVTFIFCFVLILFLKFLIRPLAISFLFLACPTLAQYFFILKPNTISTSMLFIFLIPAVINKLDLLNSHLKCYICMPYYNLYVLISLTHQSLCSVKREETKA